MEFQMFWNIFRILINIIKQEEILLKPWETALANNNVWEAKYTWEA